MNVKETPVLFNLNERRLIDEVIMFARLVLAMLLGTTSLALTLTQAAAQQNKPRPPVPAAPARPAAVPHFSPPPRIASPPRIAAPPRSHNELRRATSPFRDRRRALQARGFRLSGRRHR
jgi:hypothetical protein